MDRRMTRARRDVRLVAIARREWLLRMLAFDDATIDPCMRSHAMSSCGRSDSLPNDCRQASGLLT